MADTSIETIKSLSDAGIYSAILGFLYELKRIPEYSLLSEISFLTKDRESFLNLMEYFAGKTITFPTEDELADALKIIRLYQVHEIEGRPWKDAVKIVGFDSSSGKLAKNKLDKFKEMLKKYNFNDRSY
jgi:hypothetical protein